jgi:hypothetical protein
MGAVTVLGTFARGLADGGVVQLDTTPPSVRMASRWLDLLRERPEHEKAALREVLRRAVLFRRQLKVSAHGPIIPYLILPDVQSPGLGACISCGVAIHGSWRCPVCLMAVYIALGKEIESDLIDIVERGGDSAERR